MQMADELYRRLGCVICSLPVPTVIRKARLYCSAKCNGIAQDRKRRTRTLPEHLAHVRNPAHYFTCEWCKRESHRPLGGKAHKKGSGNRWCSRSCQAAHVAATKKAPWCAFYTGYCAACGEAVTGRRAIVRCAPCERERIRESMVVAARALHVASAKAYACQDCGIRYCPLYGAYMRDVCPNCVEARARSANRVARVRRKALQRGVTVESVNPLVVFERDMWACYLCGGAAPQVLRGTLYDDAPELEHVVPLAKGGSHSYANTRCAHRRCNREKSDTLLTSSMGRGVG